MRELKYQGKCKNYLNERKLFILFLVSLIKQLDRCRFENVEMKISTKISTEQNGINIFAKILKRFN